MARIWRSLQTNGVTASYTGGGQIDQRGYSKEVIYSNSNEDCNSGEDEDGRRDKKRDVKLERSETKVVITSVGKELVESDYFHIKLGDLQIYVDQTRDDMMRWYDMIYDQLLGYYWKWWRCFTVFYPHSLGGCSFSDPILMWQVLDNNLMRVLEYGNYLRCPSLDESVTWGITPQVCQPKYEACSDNTGTNSRFILDNITWWPHGLLRYIWIDSMLTHWRL